MQTAHVLIILMKINKSNIYKYYFFPTEPSGFVRKTMMQLIFLSNVGKFRIREPSDERDVEVKIWKYFPGKE